MSLLGFESIPHNLPLPQHDTDFGEWQVSELEMMLSVILWGMGLISLGQIWFMKPNKI